MVWGELITWQRFSTLIERTAACSAAAPTFQVHDGSFLAAGCGLDLGVVVGRQWTFIRCRWLLATATELPRLDARLTFRAVQRWSRFQPFGSAVGAGSTTTRARRAWVKCMICRFLCPVSLGTEPGTDRARAFFGLDRVIVSRPLISAPTGPRARLPGTKKPA